MRIFLTLLVLLFSSVTLIAQNEDNKGDTKKEKIEVVGMVMDMNGLPLKGAQVFVDSIKTKAKTNKKGLYKIKVDADTKLLTVYSEKLGVLSMEYTGQKKVSFLYKEDSNPLDEEGLSKMGFKLYAEKKASNEGYEDFATILDILDKRFFFAKVTNGKVRVGKGSNQGYGDSEPLVFVDDQRMPIGVLTTIPTINVESIRVIHNGSEAAQYGGLKAGNGVILIELKDGM
ncbi:MAG: hypothetical protein AB8B59_17755 [Maribacter sp.]